ncbi:hypothetical protein [uncultured Dysosmobacter sp.]|nr:hypothetical protein [uncultured Dysosmobacter sp.]
MLKLLLVPVIMACAAGGTIGMIKAIKKFAPDQFPKEAEEKQAHMPVGE